jgi:hypothetical protein
MGTSGASTSGEKQSMQIYTRACGGGSLGSLSEIVLQIQQSEEWSYIDRFKLKRNWLFFPSSSLLWQIDTAGGPVVADRPAWWTDMSLAVSPLGCAVLRMLGRACWLQVHSGFGWYKCAHEKKWVVSDINGCAPFSRVLVSWVYLE